MLENIYCVYTNNRFDQVLLFESFQDAYSWCKAATRWSEKEIYGNIRKPIKTGNEKHASIFDPYSIVG